MNDRPYRTAVLVLLVAILSVCVYLAAAQGSRQVDVTYHQSVRPSVR